MTLKARIYLLVVLAVAPAFVLLIFDHYRTIGQREKEIEQQALESTWLVTNDLNEIFKGIESLLRAAAQTPAISGFQSPECSDYLKRLEQIHPSAGWIAAADSRGVIRCGRNATVNSVVDRDYFAAAMKTKDLVVGSYTMGRVSGVPVLPLAVQIETTEGLGVLFAAIRLEWLREHFSDLFSKLPAQSSLTIVDRNGVILVRLPNSDREGSKLQHYDYVVNAPQPGVFRSSAEKNADGIARLLGFTPLDVPPRGIAIAVGYPQEAALSGVRTATLLNYLLLGSAAILAFAAAVAGVRMFIQRPLTELLGTIERWRRKDMTARVMPLSGGSELSQLGDAFNAMADELEAAMQHKDILLRELSHRVMNSLHTISAMFKLESKSLHVAADAELFNQAVSRIDAIALTYKRMQATEGVELVEFGSFLAELCDDFRSSMMKVPCIVKTDPVLLSPEEAIPLSLIANELLTNAIKHGEKESEPVEVELSNSGYRCRLTVRNSGEIPEAYRTKAKGFGMIMIDSMVKQLQGNLEASSSGGRTEFSVTFQASLSQEKARSLGASGAVHTKQ
jgi:two-component sensor histidine kinase